MTLTDALQTTDRVEIKYKCGSIHKGRIIARSGNYFIAYNTRSLVATRIDVDSIAHIRYTNSRIFIFRALGRR